MFHHSTPRYTLQIMFVRWQRRASSTEWVSAHWAAILVESVRVEGKPRQRDVAYLGGISEGGLGSVGVRGEFWFRLSKRLDQLANRVSAEDRKRVEIAIAAKVPHVSRKQYDEWARETDKRLQPIIDKINAAWNGRRIP
jgi:hypothetical protein